MEYSNKLDFDFLPAHVGKYHTQIKYPLDEFLNYLVSTSVAWDQLDTEGNESEIKNCLRETLFIDMNCLKKFCHLSRRLEIRSLAGHANKILMSNKYSLEGMSFTFELHNKQLTMFRDGVSSSTYYPYFVQERTSVSEDKQQKDILQVLKEATAQGKKLKDMHQEALGLIVEARKYQVAGELFPPEILSDAALKNGIQAFSQEQQQIIALLTEQSMIDEKVIHKLKKSKGGPIGFLAEEISTQHIKWAIFSRVESHHQ